MKNVQIIAFPVILPMIKGFDFEEDHLDNEDICSEFVKVHELYADWLYLQSNKYIVNCEFRDLKCLLPENVCDVVLFDDDLSIKVLLKSKHNSNSPYAILKAVVDGFIKKHSPILETSKATSIPPVIDLNGDVTVASSSNTKIVEKMRNLLPFSQFYFLNLVTTDRVI